MNHAFYFKQSSHLDPALTDPATRTLNADKLAGRWLNTNKQTKGIVAIEIHNEGDGFRVSVFGAGTDGPIAWPTTRAQVMANLEEEAGQRAVALTVTFDLSFMTAETYLRINKGVLVIVLFNTFHDNSGRSNYVTREFFYQPE